MSISLSPDIAAVCCYFNPLHYQSKPGNYKVFREGIERTGIRLLTVELAFGDDPFELSEYSDVLRLRTGKENIMWQKERLLNIGIQILLEEGYKKIAWLDADIVFDNDAWVQNVSDALDSHPVCQAFDGVYKIKDKVKGPELQVGSVEHYQETGESFVGVSAPGIAWAARSELLEKIFLYDSAIIGAGDALFFLACSFYGERKKQIKQFPLLRALSPALVQHFTSWAQKAGDLIQGDMGYINHTARALYHGEVKNRKYMDRYGVLVKHDFDPVTDIALGKNMVWQWASNKPQMHRNVREYFASRKEDD